MGVDWSRQDIHKRLHIVTDSYVKSEKNDSLLKWLFRYMSLTEKDYDLNALFFHKNEIASKRKDRKYNFANLQKPHIYVTMGRIALDCMLGTLDLKNLVEKKINNVWVAYDIEYCFQNPAATVNVFRVLYRAAEDAGLSPKVDLTVTKFDWLKWLE